MTNSFYARNLAFFKENGTLLYNTLSSESSIYPEIKVTRVNSSDLNYKLSNNDSHCFLNSLNHRAHQMNTLMEQIAMDTEILVLFGFECGFFIEEVLAQRPAVKHIIVIEPCLQLFGDVLHSRDIKPIFKENKSISIILNKNIEEAGTLVALILKNNRHKKTVFLGHITYRTIFPSLYEHVLQIARDDIFSAGVNLVTAYSTLHLYSYNIIKNQKHSFFLAEGLFKELRKLTCPAIIVSAGPSLSKNMHLLHDLRDKAFIVAVGTAIRILDQHGIIPHLRVAIDGFPHECNVFEGIDTCSAPLLFSMKLHSDILSKYQGTKYMMILDVDYISKFFFNDSGYEQTLVRSGYSVANLALDLISRLGFKKVILMGQDLCYHDERIYADGALGNHKVDYTTPGIVKVKDMTGEEVYTSVQFLSMRKLFEIIIKQHPDTNVINATVGGLPISGTMNMPLLDAMADSQTDDRLDGVHERVIENSQFSDTYQSRIISNYQKYLKELDIILTINTERIEFLKLYKKYEQPFNKVSDTTLKTLDAKLQVFYSRLNSIDLYVQVFYPSLSSIIANLWESYVYGGDENSMKIHALYMSSIAETTEVQRYINLLIELKDDINRLLS